MPTRVERLEKRKAKVRKKALPKMAKAKAAGKPVKKLFVAQRADNKLGRLNKKITKTKARVANRAVKKDARVTKRAVKKDARALNRRVKKATPSAAALAAFKAKQAGRSKQAGKMKKRTIATPTSGSSKPRKK
jgi:hypothetical protein